MHKIYEDVTVKGTVTAEAPTSTGAYRVLVHNQATKKIESVDSSEIGGGGGDSACQGACAIFQGFNYTPGNDFGTGCVYYLKYMVENDDNGNIIKPENIVDAGSEEPQYPFFGFIPFEYFGITADLIIENLAGNDTDLPTLPTQSIALVVTNNGYILFAKTYSQEEIAAFLTANPTGPWVMQWQNSAGGYIGGYAPGYVTVRMFGISADTNAQNMGILAMGSQEVFKGAGTVFDSAVEMIGGGMSGGPISLNSEFPPKPWEVQTAAFSVNQWGSTATSGQLVINGTNNEDYTITVFMSASFDDSLSFQEQVLPGATYSKTVLLTVQQLLDNDFYVDFYPYIEL